ncbi:hypothetical protein Cni_G13501 [Canna indica]|uniref:Uncharacterized protein n=1 Tax=Canna indica TaxID=4628 RepID=A0AAQ3KA03_9LILI|nr:hypothetical protein Cni_G13501 [Canna indica]
MSTFHSRVTMIDRLRLGFYRRYVSPYELRDQCSSSKAHRQINFLTIVHVERTMAWRASYQREELSPPMQESAVKLSPPRRALVQVQRRRDRRLPVDRFTERKGAMPTKKAPFLASDGGAATLPQSEEDSTPRLK